MTTTDAPAPGPGQLSRAEIHRVFAGLMVGILLAALDQTIIATALPTIAGELGGLDQLAWVVTAYLLTNTVTVPLWGKLSDSYGRKRLFQLSIAVFTAGSAAAGLSTSMTQLVAFRAVQGVGAGGLVALALTIIGDIVTPRERGRYQGYSAAMWTLASVAGPLAGGFFVDHLSWRWVFYINVPLALAAMVIIERHLTIAFERHGHDIDYVGAGTLTTGLVALVLVTTWGGQRYAWTSGVTIALIALTVVGLATFVWWELRRAGEPILPPRLFRNDIFTVANVLGVVVGITMFGALVFMPAFLQITVGVSATGSGLLLLPLVSGLLAASTTSGRLITRWGRYRAFPIIGTGLAALGYGLLSTMGVDTSAVNASVYMFLVGTGFGMIMPVLTVAVQNAVSYRDLGTATSAVQLFRNVGGSVGVALLGAVFNSRLLGLLESTLPAEVLAGLGSADEIVNSPESIAALPDTAREAVRAAVAGGVTQVFTVAFPIGIVAFVVAWFLREAPLRDEVGDAAVADAATRDAEPLTGRPASDQAVP